MSSETAGIERRDPRTRGAAGMNAAASKAAARERRLDRLAALCGASLVFLVGLAVLPALLGLLWATIALLFSL